VLIPDREAVSHSLKESVRLQLKLYKEVKLTFAHRACRLSLVKQAVQHELFGLPVCANTLNSQAIYNMFYAENTIYVNTFYTINIE
jgi:hypothetical protein